MSKWKSLLKADPISWLLEMEEDRPLVRLETVAKARKSKVAENAQCLRTAKNCTFQSQFTPTPI